MRKAIFSLILLATLGILGTQAEAIIFKLVGAQSDCSGCPLPVGTLSTICTGATCPVKFGLDPSNENVMYGILSTSVITCVKSIDAGVTWNTCTTSPPTTPATSTALDISVMANGTVVAVRPSANPFSTGAGCYVFYSTDGAVTWQNGNGGVRLDGVNDCSATAQVGLRGPTIACSANRCTVGTRGNPNKIWESSDGSTWSVVSSIVTGVNNIGGWGVFWDLSNVSYGAYTAPGTNPAGVKQYTTQQIGAWGLNATAWVTGANNLYGGCYSPHYGDVVFVGVNISSLPVIYDTNGNVKATTVAMTNFIPSGSPYAYFMCQERGSYMYIFGVDNNGSNSRYSMWASSDFGVTLIEIFRSTNTNGGDGGMVLKHPTSGNIYATSGLSGAGAQMFKVS